MARVPMEVVLLTLVGACWALLGTGTITSLLARSARGHERPRLLERAWATYALSKRLRFRPAAGDWPHVRAPRLEGRLGGVDMVIETCSMTIRGAPRACTRVSARAMVPYPAQVVVASEAKLVQGPRVHGLAALRIGDAFFDHALAVRATSGEAACRLLGPALRRAVQGFLSSTYRLALVLQLDEGDVSLTWLGEEIRPAMLDEACAVVACACAAGVSVEAYR